MNRMIVVSSRCGYHNNSVGMCVGIGYITIPSFCDICSVLCLAKVIPVFCYSLFRILLTPLAPPLWTGETFENFHGDGTKPVTTTNLATK